MVALRNNGGGCCGAYHICGFVGAEDTVIRDFEHAMSQLPRGRLCEIILNSGQLRQYPRVVQRIADFGFVLTSRWTNDNHGSHLVRFERCDKRHALNAPLNPRWEWPGQVAEPTLRGNLPAVPAEFAARRNRQVNGQVFDNNPLRFVGGERVRVNSPRSRRHGRTFDVVRAGVVYGYYGEARHVVYLRDDDGEFHISVRNVVRLAGGRVAPAPDVPIFEPMRHVVG